jgi:hypothetical protein
MFILCEELLNWKEKLYVDEETKYCMHDDCGEWFVGAGLVRFGGFTL